MPATRTAGPSHTTFEINGGSPPHKKPNTACAACRKRRVRCDRRDGDLEVCTECAQRGFRCVDDENKAKKILRRGRKIQELEHIYGQPIRTTSTATRISPPSAPTRPAIFVDTQVSSPPTSRATKQSHADLLGRSFFKSSFFGRLHLQCPILDRDEYVERYHKFLDEGVPLGSAGELIAQTLRAWAVSFGFDENGCEVAASATENQTAALSRRKSQTNQRVRIILRAVDVNAIPRTISWDGVRVLLLLLPLTQDVMPEHDRSQLYRAALAQVQALSGSSLGPSSSPLNAFNEVLKARVLWYAHIDEAVTAGLKGTVLVFDEDEISNFQMSLVTSSLGHSLLPTLLHPQFSERHTAAPMQVAAACRLLSDSLTGAKAQRLSRSGRGPSPVLALNDIWIKLDAANQEFDKLREHIELLDHADNLENVNDIFVSSWKIFIYVIHNIIRERLSASVSAVRQGTAPSASPGPSFHHDITNISGPAQHSLQDLINLYAEAENKCASLAPTVVELLQRHHGDSLVQLDAAFVLPGVIYAAKYYMGSSQSDNYFNACLTALGNMRWAYSNAHEHAKKLATLRAARRQVEVTSASTYLGVALPQTANANAGSTYIPLTPMGHFSLPSAFAYPEASRAPSTDWTHQLTASTGFQNTDETSATTTPAQSPIFTDVDSSSSSPPPSPIFWSAQQNTSSFEREDAALADASPHSASTVRPSCDMEATSELLSTGSHLLSEPHRIVPRFVPSPIMTTQAVTSGPSSATSSAFCGWAAAGLEAFDLQELGIAPAEGEEPMNHYTFPDLTYTTDPADFLRTSTWLQSLASSNQLYSI